MVILYTIKHFELNKVLRLQNLKGKLILKSSNTHSLEQYAIVFIEKIGKLA